MADPSIAAKDVEEWIWGKLFKINKSIHFILILFILCGCVATAQNICNITGKVSNSQTGEAIDRVNIRVAGTTRGTITNSDGSYILSLPADNYVWSTLYRMAEILFMYRYTKYIQRHKTWTGENFYYPELQPLPKIPLMQSFARRSGRSMNWPGCWTATLQRHSLV